MRNEENWLIAVTAGKWQKHGIHEARVAGLKVLALDADPNAEGFMEADQILNMDLSDHEAIIQRVKGLGKNIRGAVSIVSEAGMMLAARLREEFSLPGPHTDLVLRLLDKAVQRQIWTEKGVPGPRWQLFRQAEDVLAALPVFGFPLILKPADSSGSRGVTKLESSEDDLSGAVGRAFQFSKSGKVLMESYMDGTEFTVEVFAEDGNVHVLAVTEKKKVEGTRGTVACELATPDRPADVVARIAETVVAAYSALGYVDGPGHAEAILMKDGSVGIVEVAGRGGGFMVFDGLVPAVSGVNIARLTALQAVGKKVSAVAKYKNAAVLRFFPSRPGVLRKISGFEAANLLEGVEADAFAKVGDRFHQATVDGDRLGYILSHASTPPLARALADNAESLIRFDIEAYP